MPKNTRGILSKSARHWMVTQHDVAAWWEATFQTHYAFRYCAYQIESTKRDGWHAQIYIQFSVQVTGHTVQRLCGGNKPHIQIAKYPEKAREYCMKEESRVTPPVEIGVWNPELVRGYRRDLTIGKLKVMEHGNWNDCIRDDALDAITSKYPKWCSDILALVPHPVRESPVVTVYYGPTMTGKTTRCYAAHPGIHQIRYSHSGFMNYNGQKVVLFDEFDKFPLPFHLALQCLDKFPHQVEVKNGWAWWEATNIYMTGTEHPENWFIGQRGYHDSDKEQFLRRITSIVYTGTVAEAGSPSMVITTPTEIVIPSPSVLDRGYNTPEDTRKKMLEMDLDSDTEYDTM